MSMAGAIGAEIAYKDVLKKIDEIRQDIDNIAVLAKLTDLEDYCKEQIELCKSGWW